jgi:cob(I)alamin adenosyltransferase
MKIYTKTGDEGETSLFGGVRVWKDDCRIRAYGTVDELNAFLGLALSELKSEELVPLIRNLQNELFIIGADLAAPSNEDSGNGFIPRLSESSISSLENFIDFYEKKLPELKNFILPGGLRGSAYLHVARTVCRRAEREIVTLSKTEKINGNIVVYVNRLSDLLFMLARYENYSNNVDDLIWVK